MAAEQTQILIVDDTPGNIKIIADILTRAGYGISFANSGRQALDIFAATPPDLVLLDIVMPGMDGFEVCRRMKADPGNRSVPVIFLSNLAETDKVVKGLNMGAVDFLNKPVQKEILLARVNTHLSVRSFQRALETRVRERTRALSRTLQQIDDILFSMPSVVISLDREGCVRHWNPKAEQLTGIPASKASGQPFSSLVSHPVITPALVRQVLETGMPFRESRVSGRQEASVSYEDVLVYALSDRQGVVIHIEDVTEQVRLEEMMIQSEKMMSLGGLAAGIAHEINNPLAGMTQTAELLNKILLEDLDTDSGSVSAEWDIDQIRRFMADKKIPKLLTNIRGAGQKAAHIVNNMLSFARNSDSRKVRCRISTLLEESIDLAWSTHHPMEEYRSEGVRCVTDYKDEGVLVSCEPTRLQQVFLNIIQNCIYAMNIYRGDAGPDYAPTLSISARPSESGAELEVAIADNGPGISPDLQKKIFAPFFTTKPPGIGTGLGLSISYFIITQTHKGNLQVKSAPGHGACFLVRLPVNGGD